MVLPRSFHKVMFNIKKDSFAANIAKVFSGNLVSKLLAIAAMPLITRLFSPESFGVFGVFNSITTLFVYFSSLSYVLAILLPEEESDALHIFVLSNILNIVISVLIFLVVCIYGNQICTLLRTESLITYLWLVPTTIFFQGVFSILTHWALRKKNFSNISISRVCQTFTDKTYVLVLGASGMVSSLTLILGQIIGYIMSSIVLLCRFVKHDLKDGVLDKFDWKRLWPVAKRYKKFPLLTNSSMLLNSASRQLPTIMLATFFSPAIAGFYVLGFRVLTIPIFLLGDALYRVFFQKSAELKNKKETIDKISVVFLEKLILISLVPSMILMVFGMEFFGFVFGKEWAEAGTYIQFLTPMFFMVFISRPFTVFFEVYELQEKRLLYDIVLLSVRAISLLIGAFWGSEVLAIILYSIMSTAVLIIMMIYLLHQAGIQALQLVNIMKKTFFIVLCYGSILLLLNTVNNSSAFLLFVVSLVLVAYYIVLFVLDHDLKKMLSVSKKGEVG